MVNAIESLHVNSLSYLVLILFNIGKNFNSEFEVLLMEIKTKLSVDILRE
jgi:hypothetical protein